MTDRGKPKEVGERLIEEISHHNTSCMKLLSTESRAQRLSQSLNIFFKNILRLWDCTKQAVGKVGLAVRVDLV